MTDIDDSAPRWLIRTLVRAADAPPLALSTRVLELTSAQRQRGRQRITLPDGDVIALALATGTSMHAGDHLVAKDGTRFEICALAESVLRITADSAFDLTRAAYHLGNRHIAVEVADGYLAIEPDPVLREMLDLLGVHSELVEAPFLPETGAYGGGHRHGHDESFDDDYSLAQSAFAAHAHPHHTSHHHD